MSANVYKRLSVSDTFVVPYIANKSWDISSGSFADHRIVVNLGINYSGSIFDPNSEYITNGQYDRLVYNSINMIYYPKFLPSASSLYLTERQNTTLNDGTLTTQSYNRGLVDLGNLDTVKFFPTGANASIYVLNIPRSLTSEKILPGTFEVFLNSASVDYKFYDDGNYNLFYSGSPVGSSIGTTLVAGSQVGNVFYEQNVAIITVVPNSMRATAWRGANPFCVQTSPSVTPSVTTSVSITPSISVTPSVTPSVSISPSIPSTPSVTPSTSATPSVTPSVTPTISITPSISTTPSISVTPTVSVTPSTTPPTLSGSLYFDATTGAGGYSVTAIDVNGSIPTLTSGTNVPFSTDGHGFATNQTGNNETLNISIGGFTLNGCIQVTDSGANYYQQNVTGNGTISFTGLVINNTTTVQVILADGAC
jgi:hypothetical protein